MLWIKAFHVIMMVCWFAGLFYLPRLFVYHSMASDQTSLDRFKIMERKLYYGIMLPSGILTTLLGFWLVLLNLSYYHQAMWFHVKLLLVVLLWVYHFYCGHLRKVFYRDGNTHTDKFYRIINEIPVLFLAAIVILVIVKPW